MKTTCQDNKIHFEKICCMVHKLTRNRWPSKLYPSRPRMASSASRGSSNWNKTAIISVLHGWIYNDICIPPWNFHSKTWWQQLVQSNNSPPLQVSQGCSPQQMHKPAVLEGFSNRLQQWAHTAIGEQTRANNQKVVSKVTQTSDQ